jgi:lipoyl synthase
MTMNWIERLAAVEELEDAGLDAGLVAEFERDARQAVGREIRFSTPTFKSYSSCELSGCGKNSFPAFSVTAAGCALMCDHCQAKILEPMIPAVSPGALDRQVREMIARENCQGFLLSGGSNRRNEIRYERYYPVVEQLKHDFPHLRIAIHSALLDETRAKRMEAAGVDTAMMDVIGARETISKVYHLERPVEDFEATLAALCSTSMEVVPHIVIGLHYGRLLGEAHALDIVSRHRIHSLVLVVVMPFYTKPGTFQIPDTREVGRVFIDARRRLPERRVLLGCARPAGLHRRVTDAYAVLSGLDGIAFPAEGTLAVATAIGRPAVQEHACCSIRTGQAIKLQSRASFAA